MQTDDCSAPLPPAAIHGLALFNARQYFDAHEALEEAWRAEPGAIRTLYQGILQVAVTYLHIQRGNYDGAIKVSARAQAKLDTLPDHCCSIHVAALRRDLARVIENLTRLGPQRIAAFDQSLFNKIQVEP